MGTKRSLGVVLGVSLALLVGPIAATPLAPANATAFAQSSSCAGAPPGSSLAPTRFRVDGPSGPLQGNEWQLLASARTPATVTVTVEPPAPDAPERLVRRLRFDLVPAKHGKPVVVRTLRSNVRDAASNPVTIRWNARDDDNRRVPAGTYRLRAVQDVTITARGQCPDGTPWVDQTRGRETSSLGLLKVP